MGLFRGAVIHEINLQVLELLRIRASVSNGKQAQRAVLVLLNCSFLRITIELADKKNELDALKGFAVIVQLCLNAWSMR